MACQRTCLLMVVGFVGLSMVFADQGFSASDLQSEVSLGSLFSSWMAKHGKTFGATEYLHKFATFKANVLRIHDHNSGDKTYKLALNQYADLTGAEFSKRFHAFPQQRHLLESKNSSFSHSNVNAPAEMDWRKLGAVTAVKDQGSCGSCWAFTTTGCVEGVNQIVTGQLVSLSEQELVDCDRDYNMGCNGGLMTYAYEFIIKNGGLDTETDYPYKANEGKCNGVKMNNRVVSIDGYEEVPYKSESSLLKAVAAQPVGVGIQADQFEWQFYSSGVLSFECGTSLNHGVLIVGYGTDSVSKKDYWIVKNSWGPNWGEGGYIRMARNILAPEGMCGIALMPSYPSKTSPNPVPGPPAPPEPEPSPEVCDKTHECAAGTTCCCATPLGNFCLSWGCCPMPSATCCKDHQHCCPQEYPVCALDMGLCLKSTKGPEDGFTAIQKKVPATFKWPASVIALGRKVGLNALTNVSAF